MDSKYCQEIQKAFFYKKNASRMSGVNFFGVLDLERSWDQNKNES